MKRIERGENVILKRNLKKFDGTDLLLADLTSISADLIQNGQVIQNYAYPSDYLYQGGTTSQIILEISTTISALLARGKASVRWTMTAASAIHFEGIQKDVISEEVLDVR